MVAASRGNTYPPKNVFAPVYKDRRDLNGRLRDVVARRPVAFLVAALLLLSAVSPVASAAPGKGWLPKFKDVKGHWGEEAILEAGARGFVSGYTDATFRPQQPVTRLEALVMLANALAASGEEQGEASGRAELMNQLRFRHRIPTWAVEPLALAVERGLVKPEELSDLRPNQPAKRWEVACWLVRALRLENEVELAARERASFKDAPEFTQEMKGYINIVFQKNLMVGTPDGNFRPQKPVTRAEMAVLLLRLQDLLQEIFQELRVVLGKYLVVGVVEAVSEDEVVVRKPDDTAVALKVTPETLVFRGGKRITLADISIGDKVRAVVRGEEAVLIMVLEVRQRSGSE